MFKTKTHLLLSALLIALGLSSCESSLTDYVNPMVGTDFTGHTYPGAIVPFGMIQPGPDTKLEGWQGCSGYHYEDDTIYGFSHTHLNGTGCEDYCDILLMPVQIGTGEWRANTKLGNHLDRTLYQSAFLHRGEKAEPGYYRVVLADSRIMVELSATERVACHRYTFPHRESKGIVIDLQHRDKVISAGFYQSQQTLTGNANPSASPIITGWRESNAWNPDQKIFFALQSNVPFTQIDYFDNGTKAFCHLPNDTRSVEVYVAISGVDAEGAVKNLATRQNYDFDKIKSQAHLTWEKALRKVQVAGGSRRERRNFYTALYHTMVSPYLWSDVDGRYRGMDDSIYVADFRDSSRTERHNVYTVFSLWDTYRALHPLMTILDRKRTEDWIYTFAQQYRTGGELTMWELSAHETHCMIGYHSAPVILEASRAGIVSHLASSLQQTDSACDLERLLLHGLIATSNRQETHRAYASQGYLSSEIDNESVSKTLEYAYDDWCIAQYALDYSSHCAPAHKAFADSVYHAYMRRAQSWQNLMDPKGFMHARRNGGFVTPFDPTEVNNHYTEANSWQYSSYVPHDVPGWIESLGGAAKAEQFLDSLFFSDSKTTGRDQSDITGMIGQYAHGNEPSHHAAYLYTYLGRADKTQQMVDRILSKLYSPSPDGLCGNEDCGQMSAWYVMSAMGFYPVCPGSGEYVTTKPLFKKITITPDEGPQRVIEAGSWQPGMFYRNGQFHEHSISGIPAETQCTPAPYFNDWQQRFSDSVDIKLSVRGSNTIYYTTNGLTPDSSSARYTGPIHVRYDMVIKAVAYNPATGYSPVVTQQLTRYIADKKLTYLTHPEPQYTENGEEGLIDRLHGTENYRIGGWQGWNKDMVVVIDLLEPRDIYHIGVSCLENMRSWIFFPSQVEISVSDDGKEYRPYGKAVNDLFPATLQRQEESVTHEFGVNAWAFARYIKVKAVNYGALPSWHVSAGQQAWLFADEVEITSVPRRKPTEADSIQAWINSHSGSALTPQDPSNFDYGE